MSPARIKELNAADVLNGAIRRAVPCALAFGFAALLSYYATPWYSGRFAGVLFVAATVGGFVGALAIILGRHHRVVLVGALAATLMLPLPLLCVLGSLRILAVSIAQSSFWFVLPAGLVGELLFTIVKRLHFSHPVPPHQTDGA